MSLAYDEYLAEHIGNVSRGLHWMLDNLPLTQEEKEAIDVALTHEHDYSKNDTAEYDPYDQYFYGGNQSYAVKVAFDYAWLHHIHHNPHHWQYWVLLEDDPETGVPFKALRIPLPYIFEMVADWWTFSWKNNNLFEIFNWYADHRHKQYIHPESRMILENILKKIWNVLIMQETVAGHDISEIEAQYMRVWAEQDVDLLNWDHPSAQAIGKVVDTRETENGLEVTVEHSGIKGQKWGVRRFQNLDGSLTEAGRERYGKALVNTYKKYDEQKKKESGNSKVSSNPKSNKYARESTKLRQDILKSSKETREILNKVKKLDLENDDDYDKAIDLAQDFKKAAKNTYESVLKAYGNSSIKMSSSDHALLDILTDKAGYDDYYNLIWQNYELQHSESEDDEDLYGVPSLKKFPMPDKRHVKSAIRFFNYVDPKHEKELANAILSRIEEFGMVLGEDITVGDDNRFKKYLPEEKGS